MPEGERTATGVRTIRRRAVAAGVIAAAALGVAAPGANAAYPTVTVKIAVANNMYPLMQSLTGHLESAYNLDTLTNNPAGQAGGFWNGGGDTTRLRGITSGNARKQIVGPGPYTNPNCDPTTAQVTICAQGPLAIDGFWSADEGNVNLVTEDGVNEGTCVPNMAPSNRVTVCPGSKLKAPVAIGYLAIYRCKAAWNTTGADPGAPGNPGGSGGTGSGNGVPQSPRCETPPSGLVTTGDLPEGANMADVLDWLDDEDENVLSIADPASAPFGAASRFALIQAGFDYQVGVNVMLAAACDAANAPPNEGTCKVRLESGITQVRGAVTSGSAPVGLVAVSNLKNVPWTSGGLTPGVQDPNQWDQLDPSAYDEELPDGIEQYGTALGVVNRLDGTRSAADAVDMVLNGGKDGEFGDETDPWCADDVVGAALTAFGYAAPSC